MIPRETTYDESEWWFQLEVLDRSLKFLDQSWRAMVGGVSNEPPEADNDDTESDINIPLSDVDRDFFRAETQTVINEAREAVATLKAIHARPR